MSEKISAFISITTEHMQPEEIQDQLIETVNPIEIYFVTGDYDYIMKVTVEDMDSLREKVSKLSNTGSKIFNQNASYRDRSLSVLFK